MLPPHKDPNNIVILRNVAKTFLLGIEGVPALRGPCTGTSAVVGCSLLAAIAYQLASSHVSRPCLFAGVSLTVRRGELTVILGKSGSGKSTMLRCVAAPLATGGTR